MGFGDNRMRGARGDEKRMSKTRKKATENQAREAGDHERMPDEGVRRRTVASAERACDRT